MDAKVQKYQVFCQVTNGCLNAQIIYQGVRYQCHYSPSPSNNTIDVSVIENQLKQKQFTIKRQLKCLKIGVLKGAINLSFQHCCSRHWFKVGTSNQIPKIFQTYPVTHYQFGVIYNGPMIMPIYVNKWNCGYRIITRDLYPAGDNAKQMRPVRTMWTKGTVDQQSKGQMWYHQYVNQKFQPFGSNGNMNIDLYARKL